MAATIRRLGVCRRSPVLSQIRCSNLVSAEAAPVSTEEANPLYPPIKPKYPPGRWGAMTPSYAWMWHQSREDSLAIPDSQKRIAALCDTEMKQLVLQVKQTRPRVLDFKKYVTKTRILPGLPDLYSTALGSTLLDQLTTELSPLVCDLIVMETDQMLRQGMLERVPMYGNGHAEATANVLTRSILSALTTHLSSQFPHLLTLQFDENVSVSAMWDRHGIERNRKRMICPEKFKTEIVMDQRVTARTWLDFVLRSENPLPEFAGRDEAVCVEGDLPKLEFKPIVYGQHLEPNGKRTVEAGHVWGDPCEFGVVSVLNTAWSQPAADKYGRQHAQEARLGQGLSASFVWLAAQAHNQGFNTLVDLTYPLTSQTVLTDGRRWQFLAYQLNTLELWKDDDANTYANLCWMGPDVDLFACVQDGKVQGFNPDVLRHLISFLALSPEPRPYDLRPTLPSSDANPRDRQEFIPLKKEEVVVEEEEKYVV